VGVLVDTTPLRVSTDFRRLWLGQAISLVGTSITAAALPFQVYEETGSTLAVGALGVAQLIPLLLFAVVGGALADGLDKRRLPLGLAAAALVASVGLAVNASLDDPQLWVLYLLGAVSSGVLATNAPTVRSLIPLLIESELRPAAFALQSTSTWLAIMAGPAVGGLLIASRGLSTAYVVDVASFLVALAVFARLAPAPPVPGAPSVSVGSIVDGLRFLRGSVVIDIFALDLLAMVFGMPRALFPALAEDLGGGPVLYGLLLASVAAGAFLASLLSGWTGRVVHQGRALLIAVAAWGAAIAAVGLTATPGLVLVLLAAAGAADTVSGIYRSTIAADLTPDEYRGRVNGVEFAV
jgi:MFS family permease